MEHSVAQAAPDSLSPSDSLSRDARARDIAALGPAWVYPGQVLEFAQPHRVGALGALHGLAVASPTRARVVDLGCGSGTHILAIAALFPEAQCIGIDVSEAAIEVANAQRQALGIGNISFICGDFQTNPELIGSADYVIAHRVVSLLSRTQRQNLFTLIGAIMAPHGIALISFDTKPGDHDVEPLRALMRHHVHNVVDPIKRVTQARQIAALHIARWDKMYGENRTEVVTSLYRELEAMPDAAFLHDYLGPHHEAFAIDDLAHELGQHGLSWLTNARMSEPRSTMVPENLRELLRSSEDPIRRQAYLDFFRMTRFRTSLVCRTEALSSPNFTRSVSPGAFEAFWVASRVRPAQLVANVIGGFVRTDDGREVSLSDAASRTLQALAEQHPTALPVASLLVGDDTTDDQKLRTIAELWLADAIDLTLA